VSSVDAAFLLLAIGALISLQVIFFLGRKIEQYRLVAVMNERNRIITRYFGEGLAIKLNSGGSPHTTALPDLPRAKRLARGSLLSRFR
jgi:hypothetical protein